MPQHHSSSPPLPSAHETVDATPLSEPGSLQFATDRLPWQRSLRWTKPERNRRLLLLGGLFALLVTLLELGGFALGMRSYRAPAPLPVVIQVVLIEPAPEVPPPPPEPEPPIVARPSRIVIAPPQVHATPPPAHPEEHSDAMQARIGTAGNTAPAPQLFNPDGSIRLGNAGQVTAPRAPANPQEAAKARWTQIEKAGENPLDCRKTRFTGAYAPDESAGSGIARKYLSWAGLYDPGDTQRRARRAAEGCDPPR